MFGKNAIAEVNKEEYDLRGVYVHSMFDTIQGEGPHSGRRAYFVRLEGCNLRCTWCDTAFEGGTWMKPLDIALKARHDARHRDLCVVTGGEPLRQPIEAMTSHLLSVFTCVQFETSGSVWRDELVELKQYYKGRLQFVVSPKTPTIHKGWDALADAWKYPLRVGEIADDDGLPLTNTQLVAGRRMKLCRPPVDTPVEHVYITPIDEGEDKVMTQRNCEAVVRSARRFGYTAQVQLHKILGVE